MTEIFFAIPGDINTQSGGYGYDRRLMLELRLQGRAVTHLELGASYPHPTVADASHAELVLSALPEASIVIVDGLALGAMCAEVVAGLRAQLVALVHHPLALEGDLDAEKQKLLFDSERANLQRAKRVIVPSVHTAQLLIEDYAVPAEHITIARPGIDRPTENSLPIDPPLILSVGIQLPRKGHDIFLRALASINHLRWQAVIAGPALDADYAASLIDLIRELALEDRVKLAGQVSNTELSELYRTASIFALATRFEGYGMVFGEAMAHGLPIVSCNVGAVPETVPQAAALLVEANNPGAFGTALAELLGDHALRARLAKAAFEAGAKLISWRDSAALVGDMLDSLPANKT